MMKSNWQRKKLNEIAEINRKNFNNRNYENILYLDIGAVSQGVINEIVVYKKGERIPCRAKRAVKDKTILYSTVRPNLKHFGILKNPPENMVVSTGFATIDAKEDIDAYFLYYYLIQDYITKKLQTIAETNVSSYPSINPCDLEKIVIEFPEDYANQQVIANVLSKLDEKIELNNKINAELEKLAKTIYDFWFIQFNFPNGEGKPYRSYGGEMYYNPILKRNIPIKWQVKNLQNTKLCKIIKPGIKDFKGEKCYYATGDIEGTEIISSGMKITYENRLSRANMQPTINSIWFAKMKNTIKNLLLNEASNYVIDNCILSTGFTGLQCHENTLYYLWEYINGEYFNKKKDSVATGATQQAINETDLSHFHIIEPPDDILLKYTKLVKPYFLMINKNKHQNIELSQLRDFLLPLLMNGQVEIIDEQKTLISDKFDDIRKHWEEQEPFKFAARKDKDKDEDFKEETYDILKALAEE